MTRAIRLHTGVYRADILSGEVAVGAFALEVEDACVAVEASINGHVLPALAYRSALT